MGRARPVRSPSECPSEGCHSSGAVSRSEDEGHGPQQCKFCMDPITLTKDMTHDGGRPVHIQCKKNKRYLDDQARKQGCVKSLRCYASKYPSDFVYRMKDMEESKPVAGHKRGAHARSSVDAFLTECIEFEKTSTVRPILFLCERAFKAWYMREQSFTSEEADKRWREDKHDKGVRRKFEENTLKLAVIGHTQEIRESGSVVQAKTTPAQSKESSLKRALLVEVDGEYKKSKKRRVPSEDRTPSRRRRRRSSRSQRCRSSSSGSSPGRCAVRRGRSRSRNISPRSHRKPRGTSTCPSTIGRSTLRGSSPSMEPERGIRTPCADEKTGAPAAATLKRAAKPEGDEGGTPKSLSAEDLIQGKMDIDLSAQAEVEKLDKCVEELQKSIGKVDEDSEDKKKLEQFDMDADLEKADHFKSDMVGLLKTVRNAKLSGFGAAKDAVLDKQKEMDDLMTKLNSFAKACKKLVAVRVEKSKKTKGKQTYDEGKKAKHFQTLGAGKKRAHIGSVLMFYSEKDEEGRPANWLKESDKTAFKEESAMLFKVGESPVQNLLDAMKDFLSGAEDKMLAQISKKVNQSHRGLLCACDQGLDKMPTTWDAPMDSWAPEKINGAFCPWSLAVKKYSLRVGVSSWPMAGFGCFIIATKMKVHVCVVDAHVLIDQGEMQLLDSFDEALSNKGLRDQSWPMMTLQPGQTGWVPYGCIALVCGDDEVTSFSVAPWVNAKMFKAGIGRGESTEFLVESLVKYVKKHEEKPGWKRFIDALPEFWEANKK
jgi:hypothetical protein